MEIFIQNANGINVKMFIILYFNIGLFSVIFIQNANGINVKNFIILYFNIGLFSVQLNTDNVTHWKCWVLWITFAD